MTKIFILGKTKTGKTTIANHILNLLKSKKVVLYEAGSWAREESEVVEQNQLEATRKISVYAENKLMEDNLYSYKKYLNFISDNEQDFLIIAGVRNPDDFIRMSGNNDKFIILTDDNNICNVSNIEVGLSCIYEYINFKIGMKHFNPDNIMKMSFSDANLSTLKGFIYE